MSCRGTVSGCSRQSAGLWRLQQQPQTGCSVPRRAHPVSNSRCNSTSPDAQQQRTSTPPPPPPPPPPPMPLRRTNSWMPSRRDFAVAFLGSIIGGGAMYVYDTYQMDEIYEEMDNMEDEYAYNMEIMASAVAPGIQAPSMEDLQQAAEASK